MNSDSLQAQGLTRTAMALLFLTILIATSFWVLHLFLTPLLWATMIVVSTWPLLLRLQAVLWGRRSLAAAVMTLLLLMVLIVPFLLAVGTIVTRSEEIIGWIKSFATFSLPPLPDWVRNLPFVGRKLALQWQHLVAIGPEGVSALLTPYAGKAFSWFAAMSGSIGLMIIQFFMTLLIAAIFYRNGDKAAAWLCLFAR